MQKGDEAVIILGMVSMLFLGCAAGYDFRGPERPITSIKIKGVEAKCTKWYHPDRVEIDCVESVAGFLGIEEGPPAILKGPPEWAEFTTGTIADVPPMVREGGTGTVLDLATEATTGTYIGEPPPAPIHYDPLSSIRAPDPYLKWSEGNDVVIESPIILEIDRTACPEARFRLNAGGVWECVKGRLDDE